MSEINLPQPEQIQARMQACKEEIRALRKLYHMSTAVRAADEARAKRLTLIGQRKGGEAGAR